MIQRVYEQAAKSKYLNRIIVATDDQRIQSFVESFGGEVVLTSPQHPSGSDRVAEAARQFETEIVVNVQGDQPFIDPVMIDEVVAALLNHPDVKMATLVKRIRKKDLRIPSVVKVVIDKNWNALYFSRSLIPFPYQKENMVVFEHIGLYAYQKEFLELFAQLPVGNLEEVESLEQLRVLENGHKIFIVQTLCENSHLSGFGIDTQEEIETAEKMLAEMDFVP